MSIHEGYLNKNMRGLTKSNRRHFFLFVFLFDVCFIVICHREVVYFVGLPASEIHAYKVAGKNLV